MCKVVKISASEFVVIRGKKAIYGDLQRTIITLFLIGLEAEEIRYGLSSMADNGHDVAEYGINGMFICSKKIA